MNLSHIIATIDTENVQVREHTMHSDGKISLIVMTQVDGTTFYLHGTPYQLVRFVGAIVDALDIHGRQALLDRLGEVTP